MNDEKKLNPLNYKSYFAYLKEQTKNTSIGMRVSGVYKFLKKYIFVGRLFRYARTAFLWIQTGTFFIVYATAVIFILPVIIVAILSFCFYTFSIHHRCNKYFSKMIKNNYFYIFFLEDEGHIDVSSNKQDDGIVLYVVKNPFSQLTTAVKRYDKDKYFISMNYFYCLKKQVLDKNKSQVNYYDKGDL
ncbi:MAG: hypothetical protein E7574_01800 [Ruminococcaceae bacterium]|nr:hypothetical protein [Oscillospiraceae bacterium]